MLKNRFFLFLLSGALYASCSSDQAATNETNSGEQNEPVKLAAATGEIDPVCEMEKDSTWTEMVVNNGDTTWFCSETCKTAYVGNPAKYKK